MKTPDHLLRWMPRLPQWRTRPVLGMDIGADGVRFVAAKIEHGRPTLLWVDEVSLTELQGFADFDSVLPRLKAVVERHCDGPYVLATVPPWNAGRLVIEEMPAMDAERFRKAAAWYFQRNQHEDMLDPVDHAIAQPPRGTSDGKTVIDAVMVSVDRVMIRGLSDLCEALDLRLGWVLPASTSICHAPAEAAGRRILLDVGAAKTRLFLQIDGSIRMVRRLRSCTNDVVRQLVEQLQLDWVQANHALLAHSGLGPLAAEDPEGVLPRSKEILEKGLARLASQLRGELERSIAYVSARHGAEIDEVLLGGGLAGSPYFRSELGTSESFAVLPVDPFADRNGDLEIAEARRPRFVHAVGAALAALDGANSANLLASVGRGVEVRVDTPRRPVSVRKLLPWATAAGLVIGAGAYDLHLQNRLRETRENISAYEAEQEVLREEARQLTLHEDLFDLEDQIEDLRAIYQSRQLFTPFLGRVVDCLPSSCQLDQVAVERRDADVRETVEPPEGEAPPRPAHRLGVELHGHTRIVDDVGAFVVALEKQGLLHDIEVLRIRHAEEQDGRTPEFHFELRGEPIVPSQEEWLAQAPVPSATEEVGR